jgi:hypothetical protein
MTRSRTARAAFAAATLGLVAGGLSGCEFSGGFGATCSTSPPVPHQEFGTVSAVIDMPWVLHPGETFTLEVRHMIGYGGPPPGGGSLAGGVLSVTGGVSPSGNIGAGEPYPNRFEFEVTGQPGDSVRVGVVGGSSFQGTFPNGFFVSCNAHDQELARIQIVEPGDTG